MSWARSVATVPSPEVPITWQWPLSLADAQTIDSLHDDLRAVVERYVRQSGVPTAGSAAGESEYDRGWADAMEEAQWELDTISLPSRPRRKP